MTLGALMVRYIDPENNRDDNNKGDVTQKNIISKAFQQKIQKKQDNLCSKSKDFLSKGLILQEKNEQIDRLKKEKQTLKDQLNQTAREKTSLQKEIASLKVRAQHSDEPTNSIASAEKDERIAMLEQQIQTLEEEVSERNDQIIHLSEHNRNQQKMIGLPRPLIVRLIIAVMIVSALAVAFFHFIPRSFKSETMLDVSSLEEGSVTATISAISRPDRLQSLIMRHEPSLNSAPSQRKKDAMLRSYQKRLRFLFRAEDKHLRIIFSASNPEKAARVVRDVTLLFHQSAFVDPKKQKLHEAIAEINSQKGFLEQNIQTHQQELNQLRQKQAYQVVEPSLYGTLQAKSPEAFKALEKGNDLIQQQLQRTARDTPSPEQSNFFAMLTLDRLNESPVLRNLLDRLQTQEFQRVAYSLDNIRSQTLINERAQAITETKNHIVDTIKIYLNEPLSPTKEADLSLYLIDLFLKIKQQAIYQILNREYILQNERMEIAQRMESHQNNVQQSKKKLKELSIVAQNLRARSEQLDSNKNPIQTPTVHTNSQISLSTKIIFLLFCLIGVPLGLVGAAILGKPYWEQ
jgi:hypothetical protein